MIILLVHKEPVVLIGQSCIVVTFCLTVANWNQLNFVRYICEIGDFVANLLNVIIFRQEPVTKQKMNVSPS